MSNRAAAVAEGEKGRKEDGPGSDDRHSIGEMLRRARLERSLTMEETARIAKVPVRYLEALENDDLESLPPRIYVRGFLEALAAALSLPADGLHRSFGESLRKQRRLRREEGAIFALFLPEGEKFHWRDWMVPIFLVLAAALFSIGRWAILAGGDQAPAPPALPVAGEAPRGVDVDEGTAPERALDAAPARSDAAVRVVLRADAATWLAAERDGGPREERTVEAGETLEIAADRKVVLSLGNAGAVRLNHNGMELGFIGRQGEVKKGLVFTPRGE